MYAFTVLYNFPGPYFIFWQVKTEKGVEERKKESGEGRRAEKAVSAIPYIV